MAKTIAVKELAYFVCQSGNLTTEFFSNHDLEAGRKVHQHHQSKYNEFSKKEVYIKSEITYKNTLYIIHGFIDGVLNIDNKIIIEEIKSTLLDLDEIDIDYHKEHTVICDISNNQVLFKCHITIFVIERCVINLFHSSSMESNEHSPVNISRHFYMC